MRVVKVSRCRTCMHCVYDLVNHGMTVPLKCWILQPIAFALFLTTIIRAFKIEYAWRRARCLSGYIESILSHSTVAYFIHTILWLLLVLNLIQLRVIHANVYLTSPLSSFLLSSPLSHQPGKHEAAKASSKCRVRYRFCAVKVWGASGFEYWITCKYLAQVQRSSASEVGDNTQNITTQTVAQESTSYFCL
jgi:hypothetical protein